MNLLLIIHLKAIHLIKKWKCLQKKSNAIERSRLSAAPFQVKLSITVIRRWDAVWTGWISSAENQHKIDCCWKTTPEHKHTQTPADSLMWKTSDRDLAEMFGQRENSTWWAFSLSLLPSRSHSKRATCVFEHVCVCALCSRKSKV